MLLLIGRGSYSRFPEATMKPYLEEKKRKCPLRVNHLETDSQISNFDNRSVPKRYCYSFRTGRPRGNLTLPRDLLRKFAVNANPIFESIPDAFGTFNDD